MFTVSQDAAALLAGELDDLKSEPDEILRFIRNETGLHLRLSKEQPGDVIFAHDGKTILVVDNDVASRLSQRKLDIKNTQKGSRLSLA